MSIFDFFKSTVPATKQQSNIPNQPLYDFITIDFETANNNNYSACSVGICAVKEFNIVKKDYFLIKPPTQHFRHENTDIHGLVYDDVKNSPTFDVIWNYISHYFTGQYFVIAHNAKFDMSVLKCCLSYYNIPIPNFSYIDSVSIAHSTYNFKGNSLEDCAGAFNITISNHHNALSDAEVTAIIVIESLKRQNKFNLWNLINTNPELQQKVHQFYYLTESTQFRTFPLSKFEKIKISEFVATTSEFDTTHPLYGKNCVLTGEFTMLSKHEIAQELVNLGAVLKSSVSSKTDYLFFGKQDKRIVGEDGLSQSEEKAHELLSQGKDIKILNEEALIELLNL